MVSGQPEEKRNCQRMNQKAKDSTSCPRGHMTSPQGQSQNTLQGWRSSNMENHTCNPATWEAEEKGLCSRPGRVAYLVYHYLKFKTNKEELKG